MPGNGIWVLLYTELLTGTQIIMVMIMAMAEKTTGFVLLKRGQKTSHSFSGWTLMMLTDPRVLILLKLPMIRQW